jgi:DNA modification methylase
MIRKAFLVYIILTHLHESYQNINLSKQIGSNNLTQVNNLTETHCRYICQLCNISEIDQLFEMLRLDFTDSGLFAEWAVKKAEELEYRQDLQIKLAQNIMDDGLSVKAVEAKVKALKSVLKDRDKAVKDSLEALKKQRGVLHNIHFSSCEDMSEIADGMIHLIVTSPPYFANKEYEEDLSFNDYIGLLKNSMKECNRVLCDGGKICINIGDIPNLKINDKSYGLYPMSTVLFPIMKRLGFKCIDKIIWKKDDPWVSNQHVKYHNSQGNYRILPSTEFIYIFSKDGKREIKSDVELQSLISKDDEWNSWVSGLWTVPSVRSNEDHPAQFPDEIPRRLIKMYSFIGDNVLDPFLGSGTTIKVARELSREGFGYEKNEEYREVVLQKLQLISTLTIENNLV